MIFYFHIHGTTGISPIEKPLKFFANIFLPDLFTASTELSFIPLTEAPSATSNFAPLYEAIPEEENQFYFQWRGSLGEECWNTSAQFFYDEVIDKIGEDDQEIVDVIILGHSHGGNIARIVAQKFIEREIQNVRFHIISVCTPLCDSPPLNMPENVKTWLHFFSSKDITADLGSRLMQNNFLSPIKKKIEDLYDESEEELINDTFYWKSFKLTGGGFDPHNSSLRENLASYICTEVTPILEQTIEGYVPITNDFII